MYYIVLFITLILIAPVFITAYFYFNVNEKRLYFALYLFGGIKLFSGYVKERIKGGVYVHLSNNKALIIDLSYLKKSRNNGNIIGVFSLVNLRIIVDVGILRFGELFISLFINKTLNVLFKIINDNKKSTSEVNVIYEELGFMGVKVKIILCFNLICILTELIANAINKGVSYVKAKSKLFKRRFS